MAHVFNDNVSETFSSNQHLGTSTTDAFAKNEQTKKDKALCVEFLKEWRRGENFIYRERLKANYRSGRYFLEVDFTDMAAFDKSMSDRLAKDPDSVLPLLEQAAKKVSTKFLKKNN